MIKNIFYILIFFVSINISAQTAKYSNEFLSLGVGARALGMSNSVVASVNDVTSTYWNPAGLLGISEDLQIGLMHSEYFAGISKYDYLAAATKLNDKSALGVTVIRFGVDDIPNTLDLIDSEGNIRYDRISSFSVADYAFLVSYARKTNIESLDVGGNIKIIRRIAGEFASAWGFGLDASAIYKKDNWVFGAMFKDVTSTFNAWSFNTETFEETFNATGNEIPTNSLEITLPKFIFGAAYNFKIYKKFSGMIESDIDITTDGKRNVLIKSNVFSIDPHIGTEISYNNLVYLRLGVGNFQKIPQINAEDDFSFQPNLGLGIKFKRLALDYAFTDIGDQSIALYSHVFSIRYGINKKVDDGVPN